MALLHPTISSLPRKKPRSHNTDIFTHSGSEPETEDDEESNMEGHDEENNGQMEEEDLEKEGETHTSEKQDILMNLRRHKDEDAVKGQAVKNQKALWDKTLEFRFLLQKAFSVSNKLPREPVKSSFCNSDTSVGQAYSELISSSKKTLDSILELQEALVENNQSIIQGSCEDENVSTLEIEDEDWSKIFSFHNRIAPFRNNSIEKWHRRTQVASGAAAFSGKLSAFNQSVSDQVTGYMRDPNRMIRQMQLRRSSVGVFGKVPGEHENTTEEDENASGDPELLDDSEFYQQLLKEFFETCDPATSEAAFHSLKKQRPRKRKVVDRRASKSRKIRYTVHEKIVNFMAPVAMKLPDMAPQLFENLFGTSNQKSVVS
ncbi:hypothetical protein KSP39_PZI022749 [Platanthera zijinensis]|uniref:Uncharacterized protein n=1 Tax=Platanthera zijinensis TaxID=2320716 RepID=A0AAP0AV45_9ASPA